MASDAVSDYDRAVEAVQRQHYENVESIYAAMYRGAQQDILSRWLASDISWPDRIDWDHLVAPRLTEWPWRWYRAQADLEEAWFHLRRALRQFR